MVHVENHRHQREAGQFRPQQIVDIFQSIQTVADEREKKSLLDRLTKIRSTTVLSFINAHAINLAWHDTTLRQSLLSSDIVLRDGIGVEIVLPWFEKSAGVNMCGTDFIPSLISRFGNRSIAIFGTRSPWLENAKEVIENNGGRVVCTCDGFQSTDHYLALAHTHQPDLIVLAMGMPKQEILSLELKSVLTNAALIVNGGAVIDFMGGKVSRAPRLILRLKLEWLYRLAVEPARMFSRYVVGNPVFLFRCASLSRKRSTA